MSKNYIVHSGNIMKMILISMGKNQNWLADQMNVKKSVISEYINGKRPITTASAIAFEKATGYPALKLLMQQEAYNIFMINNDYKVFEEVQIIKNQAERINIKTTIEPSIYITSSNLCLVCAI